MTKNIPFPDRFMISIADTAELLGVGRTTVYKEIKEGTLRSKKLGSRHLVLVDSIKERIDTRGKADDAEIMN